jgi:hypothetical protein
MLYLFIDTVVLTQLSGIVRLVIRPVFTFVFKKGDYAMASFALNYVGRVAPHTNCHMKIYRVWHISASLAFCTATSAAGCQTFAECMIFLGVNWSVFLLKLGSVSGTIDKVGKLGLAWKRILSLGRPEAPDVGPFRRLRSYRYYEIMIENALMSTVFLTYLFLYPTVRFVGPDHSAGKMIFPYGERSALFLGMYMCSDVVQDMLGGLLAKRICYGESFGNMFWRPEAPTTNMSIKTATGMIWQPPMVGVWVSPFIFCSERGRNWANYLQ